MSGEAYDYEWVQTIEQMSQALVDQGMHPWHYIMWEADRAYYAPSGAFVVTPFPDGTYSLDRRERGDVDHVGVYGTEREMIEACLARSTPRRPPDQIAARAAGRRALVEKAEFREQLKREIGERLHQKHLDSLASPDEDPHGDSPWE